MKNSSSHLIPLLKSQQVLEHNEDMIASIVENIQLGRYEDSLNQYSLLLDNLLALSLEFDNYPFEDKDTDFSQYVSMFPDSLMRKDMLDDIRHPDDMFIPPSPILPPCLECKNAKVRINSTLIRLFIYLFIYLFYLMTRNE